jgi:hypothetical protein
VIAGAVNHKALQYLLSQTHSQWVQREGLSEWSAERRV